jgi:hypothetical protein
MRKIVDVGVITIIRDVSRILLEIKYWSTTPLSLGRMTTESGCPESVNQYTVQYSTASVQFARVVWYVLHPYEFRTHLSRISPHSFLVFGTTCRQERHFECITTTDSK